MSYLHTLQRRAHSQTGAMFGLDARIALAIFGILSIVVGYSAYNVIGDASSGALGSELGNLKKAYNEFHIATGEHTLKFTDLINNDSGYTGWNGPYIDGMLNENSRSYGIYSLVEGRQDVPGVPPVECSGGAGICAVWIKLTKVKDGVAKATARAFNPDNSMNAGTVRVELIPGPTDDLYFLVAARPSLLENRPAE